MKNLIFKGLNGPFKIATATQYITRIKDSTNNISTPQGGGHNQSTNWVNLSISQICQPGYSFSCNFHIYTEILQFISDKCIHIIHQICLAVS